MRIDHLLVSQLLLEQPTAGGVGGGWEVERADIIGRGADRVDFLGSDHCPMVLELRRVCVQ